MVRSVWLVSACLAALGPCTALAQTPAPPPAEPAAEPEGIADIVVTAQRRRESLQDVPIAVSAFSAAQIDATGAINTLQLVQFVPNLVAFNNTGIGSANAYFLRGLGNTETFATFDPPVGTYVDDVYIARQNANNLNLFDVERVEVLRGPQGTLFGRNTTGGAINVILKKPGDRFGGFAEVGYGAYNQVLARASVDVPFADGIAAKLSGYWQDDDGYARNSTTGRRTNTDGGWGVRAALRVAPQDYFRWDVSVARIQADGLNILNFDCDPRNPSNCDGRFVTTGLLPGFGVNPRIQATGMTGEKARYGLNNRASTALVTSTFEVDVAEKTSLALITGYVDQRIKFGADFFDGRGSPTLSNPFALPIRGWPTGGFAIFNDGSNGQFTQEVKLNGQLFDDRLTYVAGFYYFNERNTTDFADVFTIPGPPAGIPLLLADRTIRTGTEAFAGYAQADLAVTDWLTLTAGVRYTDETKRISISDNRGLCNASGVLPPNCLSDANLISPSGIPIPRDQNTKQWTPRFVVNVRPQDNVLLFASATNGFKSGGWNPRATNPRLLLPFGPEKAWSYELGVKSDWLNRRVRANVTLYWLDVTDLQTPSAFQDPVNGSLTFITRNFADYRNRGVEGEFVVEPVRNLNVFVNFGYQDDVYRLPRNAPATDAFGISSVAAQAALCRAQLAGGRIPNPAGGAAATLTPACANGIVNPTGGIATPVRTPDWTLAIGGSYRAELGRFALTPAINASYRTEQEVGTSSLSFFTPGITGPNGTFPANPFGGDFITGSFSSAAWLVNGTLTFSGPNDRWAVIAQCLNCFDEAFVQSALGNYSYLNEPRRWMVRLRVTY